MSTINASAASYNHFHNYADQTASTEIAKIQNEGARLGQGEDFRGRTVSVLPPGGRLGTEASGTATLPRPSQARLGSASIEGTNLVDRVVTTPKDDALPALLGGARRKFRE
jgi:hypothetical protein